MKPKPLDVPSPAKVNAQLFEVYPEYMHAAIEHAHGTEDPAYAPRPSPSQQQQLMSKFSRRRFGPDTWVSEGFHAGIHWEHAPLESAGVFAFVKRRAHCWHYTVSPPNTVDAMWRVLRDKRAAPHFVLGFRNGTVRPVVIQCLPLNVPGRALAHPSGPETNRAGVLIQTEVCANPSDVQKWDDWGMYKAFANFIRVINETMVGSISWEVARSFDNPHRF